MTRLNSAKLEISGRFKCFKRVMHMNSSKQQNAASVIDPSQVKYPGKRILADGNKVISRVAYKANGGMVIYTITPSSPFGEDLALRAAKGEKNLYGVVPEVFMACDEAAAAAFVQGLAARGVGSATASSSQGILLMIPEMYNSAGQLLPISFYVGARELTRHSLTIFGGHSDVYAIRDTGVLILFGEDAQTVQDLAAIAERLKWEVSLPVSVVYDGFLTSHRQALVQELPDEFFWDFLPHERMVAHKQRALDPAHPTVWGTNENPDGYMQAGLAQRPHTLAARKALPRIMAEFAKLTGRSYAPYDYFGHPQATDIIVAAGSSVSTLRGTLRHLLQQQPDRKLGVIGVRAFRPFLEDHFVASLPKTVQRIAVLDRSMTHTAQDEPLCADVRAAVSKAALGFDNLPRLPQAPVVSGGIYGVGGKDFHPGSVVEIFNHLQSMQDGGRVWSGFSVGIVDDVMGTSLPPAAVPDIFAGSQVQSARIVAYGSDGTVSMMKNAAELYADCPNPQTGEQGLYVASHAEYDSKKAGGVTVSHLRVSPTFFEECFDVHIPDYVAVHHPALLSKRSGILDGVKKDGTLVLNTAVEPAQVFASLPEDMQAAVVANKLQVYAIDAFGIARDEGLGNKISMIMQRVLLDRFGDVAPQTVDQAMAEGIEKAFSKKGRKLVERNLRAFGRAVESLQPVPVVTQGPFSDIATAAPTQTRPLQDEWNQIDVPQPTEAGFRTNIQGPGLAGRGNEVPVSAYFDNARGGARPLDTWKGLVRSFATQLPEFDPLLCNECGECAYTCPTGDALDQSILDEQHQGVLGNAPLARVFRNTSGYSIDASGSNSVFGGQHLEAKDAYGLAVDPNLCTGCGICAEVCDKEALSMQPATPEMVQRLEDRRQILDTARQTVGDGAAQTDLQQDRHSRSEMERFPSYLGASGACGGCYEPLYVSKFLQLFPDTVISNATGCSSIWGAQTYETPYGADEHGYGPAWVNPLFENNAAVGGGIAMGTAAEKAQMNASGAHVLQTLEKHNELSRLEPVQDLLAQMVELNEIFQQPAGNRDERSLRLHSIAAMQRSAEQVLALPEVQANKELYTHLALLKATVTNAIGKHTLIVGGDGWAFDIGLQMMLHVLQSHLNVVIMVLVTDVYSNTGGQMSKATPMGMDAPFAPGGKRMHRFPLGISVASAANA